MNKSKIKHSKLRNTGLLFEILTRQLTVEVLNGDINENAKHIIKEFFKNGTELNKELKLYHLLLNASYVNEARAEKFIDTVCERVSKLNADKLRKEKYNLIKEVSSKFNIDTLFASSVASYKTLASIYKLFESTRVDYDNIDDIFNSRLTIVESITNTKQSSDPNTTSVVLNEYADLDEDVRLLAYKILLESFNDKYKNLNSKQSVLLREYINDMANTTNFKDYVLREVRKVAFALSALSNKVSDPVARIKLNETISTLQSIKIDKRVLDKHVTALMFSYELVSELIKNTND
jgi:hypothetical protein